MGIARECEGAVGERENNTAVTHAMAVDHVGAHGHGDLNPPGGDVDDFDAERLRRQIGKEQRLNHCPGALRIVVVGRYGRRLVRHAQRPVKRGARFPTNAATPSA